MHSGMPDKNFLAKGYQTYFGSRYQTSKSRYRNSTLQREDLDPSSSLEASSVEVHSPFAAGVMMVHLGVPVKNSNIDYYYSTYYTPIIYITQKESSTQVLDDLLKRIISIIRQNPEIQKVYFHNFSRFDGNFLRSTS
ncbi:DNA polymerase [Bienertia sinuspersici]